MTVPPIAIREPADGFAAAVRVLEWKQAVLVRRWRPGTLGTHPGCQFGSFAPYYENAALGGEFGSPLPQVTDDAKTPFTLVVIPVDMSLAIKARQ
jgi:hypothetical protein